MNKLKTGGRVFLALVFIGGLFAQTSTTTVADYDGTPSNVSAGAPARDYTDRFYYNGSGDVTHVCTAPSSQPTFTFSVSGGTLTSVVISSNVATVTTSSPHGLITGNPISMSGATVSALNGTFIITSFTSTTFTFAVETANATYNNSGLKFTVNGPRTTAAIWKIRRYLYSGTQLVAKQQSGWRQICDNREATGPNAIAYK